MVRHDSFSLSVRSVTVDRSGQPVLHNVSLTVPHNARMAVVGPNGVGKSTLLAVMAGVIQPNSGSVVSHPPGGRIGLLHQELTRSEELTGRDLVARRVGVAETKHAFELATAGLATGDERAAEQYDQALTAWEQAGGFDFDHRLDAVAGDLGLRAETLNRPTATLSGGQLTKVGLASIMISRFDITLLDEPTNNLDRHGLELLEAWVLDHEQPLVLVSHDRSFLERTVTSVARIVANGFSEADGNVTVFRGGWGEYEEQVATARRHAEERYETYATERDRLHKLAQQKREWADRGTSRARNNPADNDRNRYQYDMDGADKQIGAAKAVVKRLEKLDVVERPWQPWELRFSIAEAERGSAEVIVADDLVLLRQRPEGPFRLGPISVVIGWGERVLIDGPNGSGKSTLLEGLLGRLPADSGSATIGPSIIVGEIGQLRSSFTMATTPGTQATAATPKVDATEATLLQLFANESGLDYTESRSLLAKFGLDAAAVQRPATTLSPGQRTRAELALFQARGVNLIILDEPTNHLDMEAIGQLEQALSTFTGTLLVVSHDRTFREALAITRTIDLNQQHAT